MPTLPLPSDYPQFLAELKGHIRETQVRAALVGWLSKQKSLKS